VQALPSLQGFTLFVWAHPVSGLQLSVVHALLSLQSSAPVPGWQVLPPQMSPVVQGLPSSQGSELAECTQFPLPLQESVVHGLSSLQSGPTPGWQTPPPQTSPTVQALPSSQASVLLVNTQPVAGLHVSVVHTLLSLHTVAVPGRQLPPEQTSPVVQAFPSLHAAVLFA
jgi:hypothetical protein